jgi:hypothetical protein
VRSNPSIRIFLNMMQRITITNTIIIASSSLAGRHPRLREEVYRLCRRGRLLPAQQPCLSQQAARKRAFPRPSPLCFRLFSLIATQLQEVDDLVRPIVVKMQ